MPEQNDRIRRVGDRSAMGFLSTKPTMIVTTRHTSGIINAGVFGAYTNLSPDHVGVAVHTSSDTYANMRETGEFVVNVPGADLVKKLAILADNFPPEQSELEAAGLTTRPSGDLKTPSISECVAGIAFKFDKEIPIAGHHLMVGMVQGGWIREDCLDADGKIDIFAARVLKDFKYPRPLYMLPGEVIEG